MDDLERAFTKATRIVVRQVIPGDGQSVPYHAGRLPPNYPVPAIPLEVDFGSVYVGLVTIDDMRYPDDPIWVYAYDTWTQYPIEWVKRY